MSGSIPWGSTPENGIGSTVIVYGPDGIYWAILSAWSEEQQTSTRHQDRSRGQASRLQPAPALHWDSRPATTYS